MARGSGVVLERLRKIAVDLDHVQGPGARQQGPGQGAAAWADFDETLAVGRINRLDDAADHARVVQKMLTEALTYLHDPHRRPPR